MFNLLSGSLFLKEIFKMASPHDAKGLSFALAYSWALGGGERSPFVTFWQVLAFENDIGRSQGVNAGLLAIYLALGLWRG